MNYLLHECDFITAEKNPSIWCNSFYNCHHFILFDHRTNDIHKLLRNLDDVQRGKILTNKTAVEDSIVHKFITVIIRLYCHCIENIKLARALEKVCKNIYLINVYKQIHCKHDSWCFILIFDLHNLMSLCKSHFTEK